MKKLKKVPEFKSEKEEAEFWAKADSTEYIDYGKAAAAYFPNLKPSVKTISIRLPENLLYALKILANKKDVPYQSLMKMYLSQKILEELQNRKIKKN